MAKKELSNQSRLGLPARGTTKLGIQLPSAMSDEFRETSKHRGLGGTRFSSTAAIGLWLSLPADIRDALYKVAHEAHYKAGRNITVDEIGEVFKQALLTTEITDTVRRLDRSHEIELRLNPGRRTHAASA